MHGNACAHEARRGVRVPWSACGCEGLDVALGTKLQSLATAAHSEPLSTSLAHASHNPTTFLVF